MSAQVAADLRAAAEVLRRDGWTQGAFHRWIDNGPCHCAEGAIAVATGRHIGVRQDPLNLQGVDWTPIRDESIRHFAALDALAETVSVPAVPQWNDAPGRTADEVIAALEAAADAAEADQAIDAALARMAKATTADEAMDWLWQAHSLGATWQEAREAYEKYEQQRGQG